MFKSIWSRIATIFALLFVLFTVVNVIVLTRAASPSSVIFTVILPLNAFFILALIFVAFFISRITSTPGLKQLTEIFNKSKDGVLDENLETKVMDEVGALADAYNRARSRLKQTLGSLTGERDEMSAILAQMNDGIIVVDDKKNIALINNAASRMFNTEAEKAERHTLIETIMDYEINNLVQQSMRDQQQHTGRIIAGPGKIIMGAVTTPMHGSQCLILLQDLTETQKSEIARRDFITNISHELRTPVTSIKALAETLKEGANADKNVSEDFLNKIIVESDRLAQLIQEMSDLLQIESGAVAVKKTLFSVNDLVEIVVERLRTQATRSGLEIAVDIESDLPWIKADKEKIERVLVNLIHNAIKFTPPGGRITVSVKYETDRVSFTVADTGIGIPADSLSRIFERFYKVDKARTGGGTGLGLAIAKQIVEAHEGKIRVESVEGKGSAFTFNIPQ